MPIEFFDELFNQIGVEDRVRGREIRELVIGKVHAWVDIAPATKGTDGIKIAMGFGEMLILIPTVEGLSTSFLNFGTDD